MAKYEFGDRIARTAVPRVGCAAVIFDDSRQQVLLTRRADNGRWCLPSGALDAGESVAETCIREVWEETGLHVETIRLISINSSPHRISTYGDGNRWQVIGLCFEARVTGGTLGLSNETTEFGYFDRDQMGEMDILEPHVQYIADAFTGQVATFVR